MANKTLPQFTQLTNPIADNAILPVMPNGQVANETLFALVGLLFASNRTMGNVTFNGTISFANGASFTGNVTINTGNLTLNAQTANRAVALNGSKVVVASNTTFAELEYLHNTTSDVQAQLNARLIASSNLSDVDNKTVALGNLGVGPSNSPVFAGLTVSAVTDAIVTANSTGVFGALTIGSGLAYNTTTKTISATGGGGGNGSGWGLTGSSGLDASVNFVGTTDAVDLVFRTNNVENARFSNSNGFLGIGHNSPAGIIHTHNGSQWIIQSHIGWGFTDSYVQVAARHTDGTEMGLLRLITIYPHDPGNPGTTGWDFYVRNEETLFKQMTVSGDDFSVRVWSAFGSQYGRFGMGADFTISSSTGQIILSPATSVSVSSTLQVKGSTPPSSGIGVDIVYGSNTGIISAIDRDTGTTKTLVLNGSAIALYTASAPLASAAFLTTDVNGFITPGGYTPYNGSSLSSDVASIVTSSFITSALTYTPRDSNFSATTSGDWPSVPSTVQQALDYLASRVKALEP